MAAPSVANGSFVSGLFRVFEAGEKLLIERAELLRLDSREKIAAVAARAGLVAVGAACLFTAWLGLLVAWVVACDDVWTLGGRIATAIGAQLVVGIALIVAARLGGSSTDASDGT
ncbi:MAG TPA: hypothetical protein VMR31_06215 [Myxococcota bacterium]|nr:hypothetical protein [Myxococcota bacterium]